MLNRIKRIFPKSVKDSVKEYLQSIVFERQPEIITLPEEEAAIFKEFLQEQGYSNEEINFNISKNDTMYQNALKNKVNPTEAHLSYLLTGLQIAQVVRAILEYKFKDLNQIEAFLDFAAGYGRVTRFLLPLLSPQRLYVSEIKARAVAFQQQQFGVQGFLSTEEPENLSINQQFDCILALSLFTHLPAATFEKWLRRLCELLSPNGLLMFTVQDITQLDKQEVTGDKSNDFVFKNKNEELRLHTSESPLDVNQYGTTYVSEKFLQEILPRLPLKNKKYCRYEKAIGSQYLYVFSQNKQDDLTGLSGLSFISSAGLKEEYHQFRQIRKKQ
jgi:SAM-dependent methyltransferase